MSLETNYFDLEKLRARTLHALPGYSAHSNYAPEMAYGRHRGPVSKSAHQAAVLIALCRTEVGWCIPLTVRSDKVGDHRGQVSLPGGRLELNESGWHAAIREFHEELGANQESVELLSPLTPIYVFASNHQVQPFLGLYHGTEAFKPNDDEVSRLIMLPLSELLEGQTLVVGTMQRGTCLYDAPGFKLDEHFVWGATALILGEFAELCRSLG